MSIGAAAAIGGVVAAVVLFKPESAETPETAEPLAASQEDQPLPTGLSISRQAEWDPETAQATLALTYRAQQAPLAGPFLEAISGIDGACPTAEWETGQAERNSEAATFIAADCSWAVDPGAIDAGGTQTITAHIPLTFPDDALGDGKNPLQEWLDSNAQATSDALANNQVHSTAYPAQRLQDIQIKAPARVPSGNIVELDVIPVWPSGADEANPLYHSPQAGAPTDMLTAIAGTESPVRLADGCGGALQVQRDGLTVTAMHAASQCVVNAQIGNFIQLSFSAFDVVGHDS